MNRETQEFVLETLNGSVGKPGLITNVEILMQDREEMRAEKREARKFRYTILASLIALILERVYSHIAK